MACRECLTVPKGGLKTLPSTHLRHSRVSEGKEHAYDKEQAGNKVSWLWLTGLGRLLGESGRPRTEAQTITTVKGRRRG